VALVAAETMEVAVLATAARDAAAYAKGRRSRHSTGMAAA